MCISSAPPLRPMAYWYGLRNSASAGVSTFAVASAVILRKAVPHAIGLILPFGLRRAITRADARASRAPLGASPSANLVNALASSASVCGSCATML